MVVLHISLHRHPGQNDKVWRQLAGDSDPSGPLFLVSVTGTLSCVLARLQAVTPDSTSKRIDRCHLVFLACYQLFESLLRQRCPPIVAALHIFAVPV